MRKIIFYIVKYSTDNPNEIFFSKNRNSLLNFRNEKIFFDSKYSESEEIKVEFAEVIFDEKLYENLVFILQTAKNKARELSEEPVEKEITEGSLNSIIFSAIQKYQYETPLSIFYFITEIFIKIIMEHKLVNGNKRVGLLFLIHSLRYFGYHFSWSKGYSKNYDKHKTDLEKIIQNLEKSYNVDEIKKVCDWVDKNSVIALQLKQEGETNE